MANHGLCPQGTVDGPLEKAADEPVPETDARTVVAMKADTRDLSTTENIPSRRRQASTVDDHGLQVFPTASSVGEGVSVEPPEHSDDRCP